ncbi:MAG: hypothetical protein A2V67_00110 [Deltaproteobacteria bacterium RBG_13_61_14]|nr:MAG: hypothetical protein A2V67_00110 [Deltaproteobacteria bacterium RBG_13_61_14]
MKIGVISDTHLTGPGLSARKIASKLIYTTDKTLEELHRVLKPHFQDVKLILHAGDAVDLIVFEMLQTFAPVKGVFGNMDSHAVRTRYPEKDVVEVEGSRIGLVHGWGSPHGLSERVKECFDESVEVIIFGHSHRAEIEKSGKVLLFNPGTPTDRRFAPYLSIGILHLENKVRGEIIRLE